MDFSQFDLTDPFVRRALAETLAEDNGLDYQDEYIRKALNDEIAAAAAPKPIDGERNFFGDTVSRLARGGVQLADTAIHAVDTAVGGSETLQGWSDSLDKAKQNVGLLRPDKSEHEEGWLKRSYGQALESAPMSAVPWAGAMAGASMGAVAGPAGVVAGGLIGGTLAMGGLSGLGTYGQRKEEIERELTATRPDLTPDEISKMAHDNAKSYAFAETGGESAGDLASWAILSKVPGGQAIFKGGKAILAELAKPSAFKAIALGVGKSMPFEVGSEVGTAIWQNEADKAIGVEQGTSTDAALAAIGPAMFLSAGMGVAVGGYSANQRRVQYNALNSEDQESRAQAVDQVASTLAEATDQQTAKKWRDMALGFVQNNQPIPLDMNLAELSANEPESAIPEAQDKPAETILKAESVDEAIQEAEAEIAKPGWLAPTAPDLEESAWSVTQAREEAPTTAGILGQAMEQPVVTDIKKTGTTTIESGGERQVIELFLGKDSSGNTVKMRRVNGVSQGWSSVAPVDHGDGRTGNVKPNDVIDAEFEVIPPEHPPQPDQQLVESTLAAIQQADQARLNQMADGLPGFIESSPEYAPFQKQFSDAMSARQRVLWEEKSNAGRTEVSGDQGAINKQPKQQQGVDGAVAAGGGDWQQGVRGGGEGGVGEAGGTGVPTVAGRSVTADAGKFAQEVASGDGQALPPPPGDGFDPKGLTPGSPEYEAAYEQYAAELLEEEVARNKRARAAGDQASFDDRNKVKAEVVAWFDAASDGDTITTDMEGEEYRVKEYEVVRRGKRVKFKTLVLVGGRGGGRDRALITDQDGKRVVGPIENRFDKDGIPVAEHADSQSIATLGYMLRDGRAKSGRKAAPISPAGDVKAPKPTRAADEPARAFLARKREWEASVSQAGGNETQAESPRTDETQAGDQGGGQGEYDYDLSAVWRGRAPQVAAPTVLKSTTGGKEYAIPGLEELRVTVKPPSGNKAKHTKLGWSVYVGDNLIWANLPGVADTAENAINSARGKLKRIHAAIAKDQAHTTPKTTSTSDLPGAGTAPSPGEASNAKTQQSADMADVPETDFGEKKAAQPSASKATPEKPAGVATSGQRQEQAKLLTKAQFNDEAQQYANFGKYSDAVASDESPSGIALRQDIRAAVEAYRDDFREKAMQVENKLRKWFDIPEGDIKDGIDKAVIALLNGESAAGGGHIHVNGGKLFTGRGTRAEQSAKKIANANGTSVVFGYTDNAVAGAKVDDGDFIIELPFDMSDYGKGDGRRIPFLLSSNFRLSGDWAYTPKQPWATRGKPPLIGEYSDFMSKQEQTAKEPWQMTREEYLADALERNEYRDQYKANPKLLPPFEENAEREWRRSVEKAAEATRVPDAVLDSYLKRFGKQVFSSTFRGVAEKGAQGYLYPDVRAEQEPALVEKKKAIYDLKPYERTWAQQRGEERKAMSRDLTRSEWAELREQHKAAVQKALRSGEKVPASVLAEYPELADAKPRKDEGMAAEAAQPEAASGERGDSFARENVRKNHYIKRKQPGLGDRKVPWELVSTVSAEGVMVDNKTFVVPFDQITDIRTGMPDLGRGEVIFKDGAPVARKVSAQSPSEKDAETASSEADKSDVSPNSPNKQTALASHLTTIKRMRGGEATVAEYRESFERVIAEKEEIIEELSDLTKAQIFERFVALAYRYKNEKKAEIVRAAYSDMVMQYNLSGSFSYMLGQKVEDVMRQKVEAATQADLDAYAEERKAARQASKEDAKRTAEALQGNIETMEEYRLYLRGKMSEGLSLAAARRTLPVEVRAKFDDMEATETRERRKSMKDADRGRVTSAAVTTSGEVIETTHTKTGEPLFVVKAAERVERDVYNEWNRTAKRMGGWYSSYRAGGAVPGFQFKTRESADAFAAYLAGETGQVKDIIDERRSIYEDNKEQSAVERLRSMADSLEERADERLSADRLTNTTRRARMAASAEAAAEADKAMAATMRNIAAAIESGAAKFLDRVRTKVQVEMLLSKIRSAQNDALRERYPNDYSKVEEHKHEKPTAETADYVEFPRYRAFRSDLASIARQLAEKDGSKRTGESLLKVADDVTDAYLKFAKENLHKVARYQRSNGDMAIFASKAAAEAAIKRSGYKGQAVVLPFKRGQNIIIMSPQAAREAGLWHGDDDKLITLTDDFGREVLDKAKAAKVSVPWMFDVAKDQQTRLKSMGIETPAELRAAVREFIGAMEVAKQNKVRELELALSGRRAKDGLDFFPTPESIARDMVDTAGIEEGMSVLEPSAGMGHIAEVIRETGVDPDVVELSGDRRELLEAKGFRVVGNDFMEMSPRGFTFGDTYKAPDGTVGVMRGAGGMGSDRVRLAVDGDERTFTYHDRDELVPVKKNGGNSGYDRIVMNPPFSDRRDVEHVQHAYELLKPGGRLVAIMGEGSFFGSDKKAVAFREWLESVGGTSEKLPEGSFNDKSLPVTTGVNTRMVVIDKSGQSAREPDETDAEETEAPKLSTALPPSSRADIPGELAQAFGKLRARVLMRKITVLESQEEAKALVARLKGATAKYSKDGAIQGLTATVEGAPRVYLVADGIAKNQAVPVLLHELGEHAAQLGFAGDREYQGILRSLEKRAEARNATGEAIRAAMARVPEDTLPEHYWSEVAAYLVENKANGEIGIVRRILAFFKKWLYKAGRINADKLTVEDLVLFARAATLAHTGATYGEGVRQSVREMFKPVDTESAAFKRWFGDSKVVDAEGKPLVVYRGDSIDPNAEEMTPKRGGDLGTGIYFAEDYHVAEYFTDGTDKTHTRKYYISLKNPFDLTTNSFVKSAAWPDMLKAIPDGPKDFNRDLPRQTVEKWAKGKLDVRNPYGFLARSFGETPDTFNKFLASHGFDGVIEQGTRGISDGSFQYVAFNSEQVKSATENTGGFSPTDPRIRYSKQFDDGEVEAAMQVKSALKKNDLKWWERIFKTFDYLSRIDPASKRIFQYGSEDRRENKVRLEDRILDDISVPAGAYIDPQYAEKKKAGFVAYLTELQKKDKATYTAANDYLLQVDRTGKAFAIKRQEGYTVTTPDGEVLASGLRTKEDGYAVIRSHHAANSGKGSSVLMKDYSNDKKPSWIVTNPKGAVLSEHDTENEAVVARREAEAEKMRADGKDEKTIAAVMKFREMTDRAFDLMAGDLRRVINEAERLGLDEPTMEVVDERKRYVILDARGNKVPESYYESRKDAEMFAKSISHKGRFQVKKQEDNEILMPMTLSAAIAQMGDLRGSYFPRQRQPGAVVMTATKDGHNIRKNFDLYALGGERVDIESGEVITESKLKTFLRDRANQYTPLGREMAKLKADGYTVNVAPAEKMPETVFEATKLFASINALIEDAAKGVKEGGDPNLQRAYNELAKTLTMNIADTFKQRGYLSSRMKRVNDYWDGFETDMLKAGVQYAKGMAGGLAKREAAQKMTLALTGREVTFAEYQDQSPDATWEDYQQFVRDNAIDPKKQPRLLEETKSWMKEMLRNDEQVDRILGTIKGLAVLKFLGFRVSSAAVNLTNMVQAVPATIAAQSGTPLNRAMRQVGSSALKYGQYRSGKASQADKEIFTEIAERGWDNPQFNHEAAAVLRSKAGNWFAKFTDAAMWMFGQAEKVNRAVTIHAAYMQAKRMSPALSHPELMKKAKQMSDDAHGVYGKETAPAWTRGAYNPLRLSYTFQRFMHNYFLNMGQMWERGKYKELAWMLISPALIAGPGATLLTPIAASMLGALGIGGDDPEEEFYTWAEQTFGEGSTGARVARHGFAGAFGVNLKGSIEMGFAMPTTVAELFGAPGSLLTDIADSARAFGKGEVSKGMEKALPTAMGTMFKSVREHREGVTTSGYSPIWYGDEPLRASGADSVARFFGFNPSVTSGVREKMWSERRIEQKYAGERKRIYDRIRRLILQNGGRVPRAEMDEIMGEATRYNERARGLSIPGVPVISRQSIRQAMRSAMRPPRKERLRSASI